MLDAALGAADRHDIQVALHADGLGESATLEETLAAIEVGRSTPTTWRVAAGAR